MMKIEKWTYLGIISVLFVALFVVSKCNCKQKSQQQNDTILITDTIPGDSVPYPVYFGTPDPDSIIVRDTLFFTHTIVDTSGSIIDYYSVVLYNDTVKNDTSALIVINETITKNRIAQRTVDFQNRRPIAINNSYTIIGEKPRNKFYIGGTTGWMLNEPFFGGSVLFVSKKRLACQYTYDVLHKGHLVSLYCKISFSGK